MSALVIPALWAAMSFSLRPPIWSTLPVSVSSPVIATFARTFLSESIDASTVAIAIPALGPSFGVAPSGTWRWMSKRLYTSEIVGFLPSSISFALWGIFLGSILSCLLSIATFTTVCAMRADSFITSPRLPVSWSVPFPRIFTDSILSTSPPTLVHASPFTTPT